MREPGNGSEAREVSGQLQEAKLQRYADAVEWFIDHPEAMKDDPMLEKFVLWIKEKAEGTAAEGTEGQAKLSCATGGNSGRGNPAPLA